MENQLRLHADNLSMFIEPLFKRRTIGYYSVNGQSKFVADESEKASLAALKEVERTSQGVIEYEVPAYIEELDINEGYETYNDSYDEPEQKDLVQWLKTHPKECADVDIVCSQKAIARIFRAPYAELTSIPWELRVVRGPDGICYLHDEEYGQTKYSELNSYAKKQHFKQKAFQRYMTVKKGVRSKYIPPSNHRNAFFRVNRLEVDSGVVVYQSETACFDINYNTIDLKVQPVGQYDLPSPSTRLQWWSNSHLSGTDTVTCGYYTTDDMGEESVVQRIVSFDTEYIKPRRIRDAPFDDELCVGSLCTFVQFIKDITFDESVRSFTLRFEPGSKRMCILDPVIDKDTQSSVPIFDTQISATDETSSVEATPRTPREEKTAPLQNGSVTDDTVPRLRQFSRQDSSRPPVKRRNTLTAEMGMQTGNGGEQGVVDNDDDKYVLKKGKSVNEEGDNWVHIGIVLSIIAFCFVVIPLIIEWLGHAPPY